MNKFNAVLGCVSLAFVMGLTAPGIAQAKTDVSVMCKDGSAGQAGKGACSHHGGVDKGASAKAAASEAKEEVTEEAKEVTGVTCKDGSSSHKGKGACSHHGGIKKDGETKAEERTESRTEEKAEASASKAPDTDDASGATAKCKDGTYSHSKHHSGSCSHHGGVEKFMQK